MAAYAALVSLTHTIEQVSSYNARQSIFNDEQQRQLDSLQRKASVLQDFLESYNLCAGIQEEESLKTQIQDASYEAEDVIETHVVDDIRARSAIDHEERSPNHLSQGIQKVIEDMDSINREVMKMKEYNKLDDQVAKYLDPVDSLRPLPLPVEKDTTTVFGDDLNQIMDKLTGQQPDLQVISITGMGGSGKTTLAKYVYENPYIVQKFDIRSWVTISQEYNEKETLVGLLQGVNGQRDQASLDKHGLGRKLYKTLFGRRYLIVIDDIWSVEAWEKLKSFFPNNDNGSRVMVTTRLLNVAQGVGSCDVHEMCLLDENQSWNLLCRKVFPQKSCPPELEKIGKEIARNCKGLPLSIAVIGGLLNKSKMTRRYWEYVAKNTSLTVKSEDDERCLKILYMSYSHLPVHLKPCLLYMGSYKEDHEIHVSSLIKLWVAEGFLKSKEAKSLEEVAEDYLKDLIDRNLVFVSRFGRRGNIKFCILHDLLRELCLEEIQRERFLCVIKKHNDVISHEVNNQRRIAFLNRVSHEKHMPHISHETSITRSLVDTSEFAIPLFEDAISLDSDWLSNFRLLRIFHMSASFPLEAILQLVNARHLQFSREFGISEFPSSSLCLLWNLQTLCLEGTFETIVLPSEIWEMVQLRHLVVRKALLPDPASGRTDRQEDGVALENLQTLCFIVDFRCTEDVLWRIRNVKKLKIECEVTDDEEDFSYYCLDNIGRQDKLQSLECSGPVHMFQDRRTDFFRSLNFSLSLEKLTLSFCALDWEEVGTKIGSLPHLEMLKLFHCSMGDVWYTVEGQFLGLKILEMRDCDMDCWETDDTPFPRLEQLCLFLMDSEIEIPSCIGDIATLRVIHLQHCSQSIVDSARKILEEQRDLGNDDLRLLGGDDYGEDEEDDSDYEEGEDGSDYEEGDEEQEAEEEEEEKVI